MTFFRTIGTACLSIFFAGSVSAATQTLFEDNFDRANSFSLGAEWTELEAQVGDVSINGNRMRLRDSRLFNPDAAAASILIDAVGFSEIKVSFDWEALANNEISDQLFMAWAPDPVPNIQNQALWNGVFSASVLGGVGGSETITISPGADNTEFSLLFWTDVSEFFPGNQEGFFIDNVVVTGVKVAAVPTPMSAGLLLAGIGVLGIGRRKRRV